MEAASGIQKVENASQFGSQASSHMVARCLISGPGH